MKICLEEIEQREFLWLQLYFDEDMKLNKLNKYFHQIYSKLREDSILIGILTSEENFSRCFIRIKDEEKFLPLIIDGKEFPFDLKLVKTNSSRQIS